jgi:hypothetical protein
LNPLGQKYRLYIHDFPFGKDDTHLALIKSVWAQEKRITFNNGTKGASLTKNGQLIVNDKFGLVDWASDFLPMDSNRNSNQPVTVSDMIKSSDAKENEDKLLPHILAFSFPRANSLIWDPYIGNAADSPVSYEFQGIKGEDSSSFDYSIKISSGHLAIPLMILLNSLF